MALIACPECKKEISDKAKVCPYCGIESPKVEEPYKGMTFSTKLYGVALVITIIFLIRSCATPTKPYVSSPPPPPPAKTQAEILKDQMRDKYYEGIVFLKKNMKDPSSFEVESAYALPNMTVCYKYRSKNGFGALDIGYAIITNDTVFVREKMSAKEFEKKLKEECENPLAVKMK